MEVLTPLEFYRIQFPDDANLLDGLESKPFFSLMSMVQFAELYQVYLEENK